MGYIANHTGPGATVSWSISGGWIYVTCASGWDSVWPSNDRYMMAVDSRGARIIRVTNYSIAQDYWTTANGSMACPANTEIEIHSGLAEPEIRREATSPYVTGLIFDGTVVGVNTPIPGATVTIHGVVATTGSDGRYLILLPNGESTTWSVAKTGYFSASGTLDPSDTGQTIYDVGIDKEPVTPPPEPATPSIAGNVKSIAGVNLAMVSVKFGAKSALTDTAGNYRILSPEQISGPLDFTLSGYRTRTQYVTAPASGELTVNAQLEQTTVSGTLPVGIPTPPPTAQPNAWDAFYKAGTGLTSAPGKLLSYTLDAVASLMLGRQVTQNDVLAFNTEAVKWLPGLNVFAKGIYGVDLTTGEPASWEDITQTEMINFGLELAVTAITAGVASQIGKKVVMAQGTQKATSVVSKLDLLEDSILMKGGTKAALQSGKIGYLGGVWAGVKSGFKSNPLMSIFVVTEIPNLIQMTQFARTQAMEELGQTPTQANIRLSKYEKALYNEAYALREAVKASSKDQIVDSQMKMISLLDGYMEEITLSLAVLKTSNFYESAIATYEYYKGMVDETTLKPPEKLPSSFQAKVKQVIDGDTVKVLYGLRSYTIRLAGVNSPETGEKGKTEAMTAMSEMVWGREIQVVTDIEHQFEYYGRVLGKVIVDGKDVGEELIKRGLCHYYPTESSVIDQAHYIALTEQARISRVGVWALLKAITAEAFVEETTGTLAVTSNPTRANIYLNNQFMGLVTPETMKDLTPGNYALKLERIGYADWSSTYAIRAGEKREVHADLVKL